MTISRGDRNVEADLGVTSALHQQVSEHGTVLLFSLPLRIVF